MKKTYIRFTLWVFLLALLIISGVCLPRIFFVRQQPPDSLIRIISRPKKYHNKQVHVAGFLQLEFEGNALYLHREDASSAMTANAVWIVISDEMKTIPDKFNNKYVVIDGKFNAKRYGHMGLFSGTIGDISSCYVIDPAP